MKKNLYKILSLKPSHKLIITKPIPDASSMKRSCVRNYKIVVERIAPVQNIVTKAVTQTDEHSIGSSIFKGSNCARFRCQVDGCEPKLFRNRTRL